LTLNEIITAALSELNRGQDAQSMQVWRDKLTGFANEAIIDLAGVLHPRRTEAAQVLEGHLESNSLEYPCTKIIAIHQNGMRTAFVQGPSSTKVKVLCKDGPIQVTYRYLPPPLKLPNDVPALTPECHPLIVTYVVARERTSGDVSTQRGANIYFELYNMGKRTLRCNLGEDDAYSIVNRY